MDEVTGHDESLEDLKAQIKKLKIDLKKSKREVKRLQQDRDYLASLNEQAYKMRDFFEAEYKQQFLYSRLILTNSPDILFIMSLSFKLLLVTNSFLETFGRKEEELEKGLFLNEIIEDKLVSTNWDELKKQYRKMRTDAEEFESQITVELNGDRRILDTHTGLILKKNFYGYVVTMSDVTELVEAKEKAESADRAKSDFLANMSHEIRTPMNAITGMAEFIVRDTTDMEARENALQIKSASNSLLAIINDILDFSKIESGKMELIPVEYQLSSTLNDVVNMINIRLQSKPVELILELEESIPYYLYGDEIRFRQILINILNNAVKFTSEGNIWLKIWHKLDKENDEIMLYVSVRDSGIGIRQEDIKKLFSSFNQVDTKKNRSIEGTGLGLAISKRLATMMDGDISVESEYGKGTTFTFWVKHKVLDYKPMGRFNQEDILQEQEAFVNSFTAPSARVLIVDDNIVNLKVAKGMILPYKCEMTLAASGQEAVTLAGTESFDIIFMDHMMPVMDGVEAMKLIREIPGRKDSVIIALTANAISGVKEKYREAGFQDFIAKPIVPEKLEELLLKYIPEEKRMASDGKPVESVIDEDILRQVYTDGLKKQKLLPQLLAEEDFENYIIQVHALKSVAAAIKENELSELAKSHEMAGKEGNYSFIQNHFQVLMEKYEALISRLGQQFADEEEDLELLDISDETKDELVEKLKKAVEDFDMMSADEILQQLSHVDFGEKKDLIMQMKEAAEEFDFDGLEQLIWKL